MSKKANTTLIGAFVLAAIGLLVGAVVFFGSGRFFKEVTPAVLYFEGSVKGLRVGAPVDFRGVPIGTVKDITLLANVETMSLDIPVFIEMYPERIATIGRDEAQQVSQEDKKVNFRRLIDKGLRARLELQSVVTGQLMISLDFYPGSPARLAGDGSLQEIPTLPSTIEELSRTLAAIDFEGIMSNLNKAIEKIETMVSSSEAKAVVKNINAVLLELSQAVGNLDGKLGILSENADSMVMSIDSLVKRVDAHVDSSFGSLSQTMMTAEEAMKEAASFLQTTRSSVSRESPLMAELTLTLRQVSAAARSVRGLADAIERNPESLLSGKGGSSP